MADNVTKMNPNAGGENAEHTLPSADELHKLSRFYTEQKGRMDKVRGEIGAEMKDAEDNRQISKAPFKLAMKLLAMDASRRESFLIHMEHYFEVFGVNEGRTRDMFKDAS